jgi:formyl-CoA transferase
MGVFPTADGQVNIAASSPAQFARFCDAACRPEWAKDARWSSGRRRFANRESLNRAIAEETAKHSSAWWIERLEAAGVPCGPILTVDEVFADPQVQRLAMAQSVDHPRLGPTHMVASPINLEGLETPIRSVAPPTPEHTEAVLSELGYGAAEIATMRRAGAI